MFDEVGAVAWEHVDDGNLDHRVAGGLGYDRYQSLVIRGFSVLWLT